MSLNAHLKLTKAAKKLVFNIYYLTNNLKNTFNVKLTKLSFFPPTKSVIFYCCLDAVKHTQR